MKRSPKAHCLFSILTIFVGFIIGALVVSISESHATPDLSGILFTVIFAFWFVPGSISQFESPIGLFIFDFGGVIGFLFAISSLIGAVILRNFWFQLGVLLGAALLGYSSGAHTVSAFSK